MSNVLETVGHVKCDCYEVIGNIESIAKKTSFIDKEPNYTIFKKNVTLISMFYLYAFKYVCTAFLCRSLNK